jgi:hypothetical protein
MLVRDDEKRYIGGPAILISTQDLIKMKFSILV